MSSRHLKSVIITLLALSLCGFQQDTRGPHRKLYTPAGGSPTIGNIAVGFKGGSTASATLNIGNASVGQMAWIAVGTDPGGVAGGSLSVADNCNTGSTSNSYTQLTSSPITGNAHVFAIYAWATVGATKANCTVTVTETTTTGDFSMAGGLVSGGTTVEQSQINYQGNPGTATDALTSTATGATSHLDLVIGFYLNVQNGGAAVPTAGTGYTIQQTTASGPVATESLTQTSTGAATATFTTTTASTGGGGFTGVICFH